MLYRQSPRLFSSYAGGDAHVAQGELGHEGVVRAVDAPALKIEAQAADDRFAESQLLGLGVVTLQAGVVGGGLGGDCFDQRHELLAQVGKQAAHAGGFHTKIFEIDQRVGDVLVAGEVIGKLAAQVDRLFEQWDHGGKVVARAGFRPGLVGFRHVVGEPAHELGRHFQAALEIAARRAQQAGLDPNRRAGFHRTAAARSSRRPSSGLGGFFLRQARQGGHLAAAGRGPARRHIGGLVPTEHGGGKFQVVDLRKQDFQLVQFFFHDPSQR